jgi:haloacetate dehalogenase
MAQPEPFPETLMSAVPAEWFLGIRGKEVMPSKAVFDEYVRCFSKKTITGACRDYRAGATIDFEMDSADKDRKIGMPLLLIRATHGALASLDAAALWGQFASNIVDIPSLPTAHHVQEDAPDQVYDHFVKFFTM